VNEKLPLIGKTMIEESKYMNQFNKSVYTKLDKLMSTLPDQNIPDYKKKNIIYCDELIWEPFTKYIGTNT